VPKRVTIAAKRATVALKRVTVARRKVPAAKVLRCWIASSLAVNVVAVLPLRAARATAAKGVVATVKVATRVE
jgi:hypothetical protein